MLPLFDTYLLIDWSAASKPRTGADSIWLHLLARRRGKLITLMLDNPATRNTATNLVRSWLQQLATERRRVLVGFDFPFGYPHGFAARLGLGTPHWRAVWDFFGQTLFDSGDNVNDRFEIAAYLNDRISGGAYPFWGCPAKSERIHLAQRRQISAHNDHLPERRLVEMAKPSLQTVWKLYTTGSVGSQALTGIPRVRNLRDDPDLRHRSAVWPFETGLRVPSPEIDIVFAEIYPSLVPALPDTNLMKDARQLLALARYFAELDEAGSLARLMALSDRLAEADRSVIEGEEGWVLGVVPKPIQAAKPSKLSKTSARTNQTAQNSALLTSNICDLQSLRDELRPLGAALIATAGDPTIIEGLVASPQALEIIRAALDRGAPLLVDSEILAAATLPMVRQNPVLCFLNDSKIVPIMQQQNLPRAAAVVELWRPYLGQSIVLLGNAPEGLRHLLQIIARGEGKPVAIIGFPIGTEDAADAKAALIAMEGLAWITFASKRGGNALAAAALGAILANIAVVA